MKKCVLLLLLLALATLPAAAQGDFTGKEIEGINAFLQDNLSQTNKGCMVIGIADENGTKVFAAGRPDDASDRQPDGDSVFLIGSVSKTFTTLLFEDMVQRHEVNEDDPVAKYLPNSVKVPSRNGRQITLLDLATHSAGFPINPNNMTGRDAKEQYETYTVQKMYDYLPSDTLSRDPGTEFEYSNVGMALLGDALALRAGSNFESLVVDRICRPLHMDSTSATLSPQQKARLAIGHENSGKPSPPWMMQAYVPAGGIFSTANDLLKYVSAQAGLAQSELAPLMEKTHVIRFKDSRGLPDTPGFLLGNTAMDWVDGDAYQPPGMELLGHAGGAGSYHAFVGFDKKQRRGVVVLTTVPDFSVASIGWTLLQRLPLTRESAVSFAREIVGLGFSFDFDKQSHALRVTKVFPKSPADQAGITAGFLIEKIEDVPTASKSIADCLRLLHAKGTGPVRLQLVDPARDTTNTVQLAKARFVTFN